MVLPDLVGHVYVRIDHPVEQIHLVEFCRVSHSIRGDCHVASLLAMTVWCIKEPASLPFGALAGSFYIKLLSDEEDAQGAGAAVAGDGAACGGLVGVLETAVFGDGGHDGLAHQEDSRKTVSFCLFGRFLREPAVCFADFSGITRMNMVRY